MTIYIVWGDNGEDYEDHRDWAVCAYTTKEAAKQHAVAAEVQMQEIVKDGNKKRLSAFRLAAIPNTLDPLGPVGASVTYFVEGLELKGPI